MLESLTGKMTVLTPISLLSLSSRNILDRVCVVVTFDMNGANVAKVMRGKERKEGGREGGREKEDC